MSDAVRWLVGIGCAAGLLVSIVTLLPLLEMRLHIPGDILQQSSLMVNALGARAARAIH